jgi:CheY-like chemotaxis protein
MKHAPILQLEDDENDVLLLKYAFKHAQIPNPLVSVTDGQKAVDYLAGHGEFADRDRFPPPCMVLLDLKTPRRSGLEVLRWIRAHPELRTLIVLMFTASANLEDIREAYEIGANAFVIKPAGTDRLTDLVRVLHTFWFGYNQFPRPSSQGVTESSQTPEG